jgi:F0F1-type ATP synthase assembly protein I
MRLAGTGIELAAAVGGFALLGYWIDRHYGSSPKGLLIGALLGLVGGFYNLIKASLAVSREARELDREAEHDKEKP